MHLVGQARVREPNRSIEGASPGPRSGCWCWLIATAMMRIQSSIYISGLRIPDGMFRTSFSRAPFNKEDGWNAATTYTSGDPWGRF